MGRRDQGTAALIAAVEDWLVGIPPASRRRIAVHLFVWSAIATPINVVLYVVGIVSLAVVGVITLTLSWLAITLTAADLVATTDVREAAEEGT